MEALLKRRSIRSYKDREVSDEKIERLLDAAMRAPSAGNQQPWHFIVIDKRDILDRIPEFHPYAEMVREAPVAVVVCGDLRCEKHEGFWVQDCSAAVENMLIAAVDEGLGAVWVGIYPVEERVNSFRKLLDIPEEVIPLALVPLGHPDHEKPPADRFQRDRIHFNRF